MRVAGYLRDGWMPGAFGGYVFGARLSDAMQLTSVDGSISSSSSCKIVGRTVLTGEENKSGAASTRTVDA